MAAVEGFVARNPGLAIGKGDGLFGAHCDAAAAAGAFIFVDDGGYGSVVYHMSEMVRKGVMVLPRRKLHFDTSVFPVCFESFSWINGMKFTKPGCCHSVLRDSIICQKPYYRNGSGG